MLMLIRKRLLPGGIAPELSFDVRLSARITSTGTQTVAQNTVTKVEMDTVQWDNGAPIGSPIADETNYQLIIPEGKGGVWQINHGCGFIPALNNGFRRHWIEVDGTVVASSSFPIARFGDIDWSIHTICELEEGAVIEAFCYHSWVFGSLPFTGVDFYKQDLTVSRIGAADA
jgi:hypothetical protein